jgi:hypothetical protein
MGAAMMRQMWMPALLLVSIAAGTYADRPADRVPLVIGGYRVLAADFHLHPGLGSGGSLTPWGLVTEAQRQDLDVIAITGHNTTWDARVARGFSHLVDGPVVLTGEEVTSRTQDLVAVGIEEPVSPALPLRDQVEAIHRQGGVAIAAHPSARYSEPYRDVMSMLDGTEVCHPMMYARPATADELATFAAQTPATPIGSSDFHTSGRLGVCRTFLFVDESNERGILGAIRAHRTVVYGLQGRAFGDPALVRLADAAGLREVAARYTRDRGGVLDWVSRIAAGVALFGVAFATRARASRRGAIRPGYVLRAPSRFPETRSSRRDP